MADSSRYKLYKVDLLQGKQELLDDLEFLRISEPGFTIGLLPIGERDMRKTVRFIIKDKAFYALDAAGEIMEQSYHSVRVLIDHMLGQQPKANILAARTAPVLGGEHGTNDAPTSLIKGAAARRVQHQPLPKGNLINQSVSAGNSGNPAGRSIIPDRYKIKRAEPDNKT